MHLPDSAVTPLIETRDIEDTPIVPTGDAIDEAFAAVWSVWPAARRSSSKKAAASFRTAVRAAGGLANLDRLVGTVRAFCDVWASWPASEERFIPLLPTWLNQERWTTPLPEVRGGARPTTVDIGREASRIIKERQAAQHLAVSA